MTGHGEESTRTICGTRAQPTAAGCCRLVALAVALAGCTGEVIDAASTEGEAVRGLRQALTLQDHIAICQSDARVLANVVALDVCVGADLFFRETFEGNGRSCASCHAVDNNFTIDPAFIATRPDDDPLFVGELDPALAEVSGSSCPCSRASARDPRTSRSPGSDQTTCGSG